MAPDRVFLDTSVVNFIVEYSEAIFEGFGMSLDATTSRTESDLDSIFHIFKVAVNSGLEIVISSTTFVEINNTKDKFKQEKLQHYCNELWVYFHQLVSKVSDPKEERNKLIKEYLFDYYLPFLPDDNDQQLIFDALYYKCNYFCTRDWKTILKYRDKMSKLPIKFITPTEWLNSKSNV